MSSWYSKLLTTTTSQISSLQSRLLQSDNDGDTEDDTHVCRVLRAYYTEKGRPFPGWLPPDPKAPPPAAPVYSQPQVGSRYGGMTQQPGGSGGLSSLWDNNPVSERQDPQSLRRGRGVPPPMRGSDPAPARQSPFARSSDSGRDNVQPRPLPSQRAGSYQQTNLYARESNSTPPGSSTGGSAQDKLRQRLWGARTASPASGGQDQGPFQPPSNRGGSGGYGGSSQGGGYGDDYEDRFAPGGMYDASGRSGGSDKPFMAANAPWASNEYEFSGSGGGRSGSGLPGGPKRAGLPSGPRMR